MAGTDGGVRSTKPSWRTNEHLATTIRLAGIHALHEDASGGGSDRNLRILLASVQRSETDGAAPDSRTLFYLAREYTDHGRTDRIERPASGPVPPDTPTLAYGRNTQRPRPTAPGRVVDVGQPSQRRVDRSRVPRQYSDCYSKN